MNTTGSKKQIYADHIAASPVREEALAAMLPLLENGFGNPQSVHARGQIAAEALELSRGRVAALAGVEPTEVIFTATGSEANNLAVQGIARARRSKSNRLIMSSIEHLSVLGPATSLEKEGFELVKLPVDEWGNVAPCDLEKALSGGAAMVSVIHASTEIGTIQPIRELASLCREADVPMHTDSCGAAGVIPANAVELGVSSMSIAGQNFGGPPGAAALIVRRRTPIRPLITGGIQERNLRAGQENIPAIAGMGAAAESAASEIGSRSQGLVRIRDSLISRLPSQIDDVILTGHPENRLPNHASFCIKYIEGEGLLLLLNQYGIMAASGSACTSKALKSSHVLQAIGLDAATAQGSIVFTLGPENRPEDVDGIIEVMKPVVSRLREMSPLYQRKKDDSV